ncbi:three-helix bundle dimerization domain-containing protein [Rhodococcus koreensis]
MNAVIRPGRTEEQHLDAVRDRLARRFPDLDPDLVDRAIDLAHHRFDGRPVRDFVPLLVERAATVTLGGGVSHPTDSSESRDSGAYLQ